MKRCARCPRWQYEKIPEESPASKEVEADLALRLAKAHLRRRRNGNIGDYLAEAADLQQNAEEQWEHEGKIDNVLLLRDKPILALSINECIKAKIAGQCHFEERIDNNSEEAILDQLIQENTPLRP